MKVLDLAEFYSERGGGVRAYLSQLVREGTHLGHDLVVVAPGPRDEALVEGGGRILRVRGPALPYDPTYHLLWRIGRVRRIVSDERPDVLEVSSPYMAAAVATTMRDIPVKVLVLHSDSIGAYARPVLSRAVGPTAADALLSPAWAGLRALAGRFDATVVAGRWLADRLVSHGLPRVVCVPFGITRAALGPSRADPATRRELLGPLADVPGAALAVVAGRLAVEKRVGYVLEALARVARVRPLAVVVLGDGPERTRLEGRAITPPVTRFLGFVRDREVYARTLASADVLVHGCAVETFGFVVGEALCSGVPVVVPDAGGAAEFATPECAERYPAEGPPLDCAVATHRLLDRPRGPLRLAAVAAGRRLRSSEEHFEALFGLYQRLLDERRGRP